MTTYYDRSTVSFLKQPFAHPSHAIRSPSARPPLVVRAPLALFTRRQRAVRTVRVPFASCPNVLRASSASCSRTVPELSTRPPRTPFALCWHTIPVLGCHGVSMLSLCWCLFMGCCKSVCLFNALRKTILAVIFGDLKLSKKCCRNGAFASFTVMEYYDNVLVIVIVLVSSTIVLVVGISLLVYIRRHRYIQMKRRAQIFSRVSLSSLSFCFPGSNDAEKLAKSLYRNSLNFKYSALEKATNSFDEANKLG
ncbi:hypothetical protein DEO72_LG8g2180 [Vigna unguiculata]|uniref:Uncharacterized protein n=1 Tax=Vigna unguiculata TaxID=3917 RepID=A0A4D6MW71_VIGUN|nr:hypothetical protein DEO72_LG8g2180 [Vigna unguiculata]